MWILAQSHFLSYHFSGLASFDVLFLSSYSTFESQRLSQFSHPVHVFLVANKNSSRKSIYWKNIQQLRKEARSPEPQQNHITGTMSHHFAVDIQWGHPCWLQLGPGCRITCTILSSVLLCPCLSLSFNPVQSCVGASDCPSLGDTCIHWVPQLGETMAFLLNVSDGVGAPPTQDLYIEEDTLTLETQMHHYVLTFNLHPRRWRHWGWLEAKESDVMSFLGLGTLYLSGGFRQVKWLAWGI